jgi:hypothetical protein
VHAGILRARSDETSFEPIIVELLFVASAIAVLGVLSSCQSTPSDADDSRRERGSSDPGLQPRHLFLDVHHMGPGKVDCDAIARAHARDLAAQGKHGPDFTDHWVAEAGGNSYYLSSAADTQSIRETHAEDSGLSPDEVFSAKAGSAAAANSGTSYFLDVHEMGAGKVTAEAMAAAHQKDLAVQAKHGVNFINYWVDERAGRIVCLSRASDEDAIVKTHAEAHGLIPSYVVKVKPGG